MRTDSANTEADRYVHSREMAIAAALNSPQSREYAVAELLGSVPDLRSDEQRAKAPIEMVAFENVDAETLGRAFVEGLGDDDSVKVACFWFDKTIIKMSELNLSVLTSQQYIEPTDAAVDTLVVVRHTLDPEPIAAILHRCMKSIEFHRARVLTILGSPEAEDDLRALLPASVSDRVVCVNYLEADYGQIDPLHPDDFDPNSPTMQRIPTDRRMPLFIRERIQRPKPEPDDDFAVRVL